MIRHCLETSEMYCSLMLEDARGVAYRLFSKSTVSAFAIACFAVAAASIAFQAS